MQQLRALLHQGPGQPVVHPGGEPVPAGQPPCLRIFRAQAMQALASARTHCDHAKGSVGAAETPGACSISGRHTAQHDGVERAERDCSTAGLAAVQDAVQGPR